MGYAASHPLKRVGGRLALDFLNTADWSADGALRHEKLENEADLAFWTAAVGLDAHPAPSVGELRAFRAALRPAFAGGAGGPKARADLNRRLARLVGEAAPVSPGAPRARLDEMIALDAASLLADQRLRARVRVCRGDDCGWLFLDLSPTGRRRWCSMEDCGNRAKARRHHERRAAG